MNVINTVFIKKITVFFVACLFLSLQQYSIVKAYDVQYYSSNGVLYFNPEDGVVNECSTASVGSESIEVSVEKDFKLGTNAGLRPVNLLKALINDFNFKDFQAAGIVGNFMHESGGSDVPPDINEGGEKGPPKFSGGYGWAQWTGGRQVNFIDFAVENGYMSSKTVNATDAANYAWLTFELTKTSESEAVAAVKNTNNVSQAAATFEEVFERAGVVANESRDSKAKAVLDAYRNNTGVKIGSSSSSSSSSGSVCNNPSSSATLGESADFGEVAFPITGGKSVVKNPTIFANKTTTGGHPYSPYAYDIEAPAGTEVVAYASGVVTRLSEDKCGSALVGVYNKENDTVISYMHMNKPHGVKEGDPIKPGDHIGTVASVSQYECVNVDHLHIDAIKGYSIRPGCTRESCPSNVADNFVDLGPDLFTLYTGIGG